MSAPVPSPLAQNREFETSNNLLTLEIDHAAFGVAHEMRWRNTVAGSRLFFIHQVGASHADGGSIRNRSHADSPAIPLQAGLVYFLPANQEISGHFRDGLWLTGFHLRLEAIAGYDAFSGDSAIRSRGDQVAVIAELAGLSCTRWCGCGGWCTRWRRSSSTARWPICGTSRRCAASTRPSSPPWPRGRSPS